MDGQASQDPRVYRQRHVGALVVQNAQHPPHGLGVVVEVDGLPHLPGIWLEHGGEDGRCEAQYSRGHDKGPTDVAYPVVDDHDGVSKRVKLQYQFVFLSSRHALDSVFSVVHPEGFGG